MTPITITLPRATVEQALHVAENAGYPLALIKALRAALAQQRLTDAQQEMERSIDALRAALARQAEPHRDLRAALQAPGCERLREWVEIGPVQRAALETFAAALAQQAESVEPVAHRVVAGALFDFMGWLTSRRERLVLSSIDDAAPAADAIKDFAEMRGLSLDDAKVQDWNAALAQQAEPDAYGYASRLAVAIWEKHYKDTAPHWKPLDDLVGVLTQIDNMAAGMTRLAQQAEPVEPVGTFLVTGNEFCGAPPASYATWGDALASMFAAGTVQGLRISALAQQAEPVCKCDLRTRLVGDGCEVCNPELAAKLAQQAEPDHETRAELAEQQVVQLAEERDHYRNLWQKAQQAEPVEPVAWECKAGGLKALTQRQYDAQPPNIRRHYTRIAPLQRKPLTEEEIEMEWSLTPQDEKREGVYFARRIERAHGITDPQIEDRLARHGIPMPEGDPK